MTNTPPIILLFAFASANIGFDAAGTLKVFDFDLSRVLPSSEGPDAAFQLTGKVGSPRYMAPEVSAGNPYNLKADVYSFGLLTYQMLTGKTPWKGLDYDWSRSNKQIPKTWSSDLRLALENCQSPDHKQRPSMSTCVTEIEVALTSTNKDDETIEADDFELGMCGVALPICSYEDFEELLGCAVGGIPEEEEYQEKS
jgi:serine/threonine protein kinase